MSCMISERVDKLERNSPFMADVTQRDPGLRIPRIVMHVCVASTTTATPLAFNSCSLLNLRTPGNDFDNAGQFAQSGHFSIRQVPDVSAPHERQKVVLTRAVKADIPYQDHFIIFLSKEFFQVPSRILTQSAEQLGVQPRHPRGSVQQAFPLRIFANRDQDFAHRPFDPTQIDFSTVCRTDRVVDVRRIGRMAFAIKATLFERDRIGQGAHHEISSTEFVVSFPA